MLDQNLKALRQRRGLSQEELASCLHVVRQTISKWEKGLSVPDAQMLIRIAGALDTTVNELLGAPAEEALQEQSLAEIAARLEALNEQLADSAERRRKALRAALLVIAAAVLLAIGSEIIGVVYHAQVNAALDASEAVIGGADEPTFIFLASSNLQGGRIALMLLMLAGTCIGLYRTRRR